MAKRLLLMLTALCLSCAPAMAQEVVRLATTSSATASGLLDLLLPAFERSHGVRVEISSTGSGAALRRGREGDADVLLVHSPEAEQRFIAEGYGIERLGIARNDFVIVGPVSDPAGVAGVAPVDRALARIRDRRALFLSRGDDSGTHRKEAALWRAAGIDPYGQPWYQEMGMKIGDLLRAASARQAYTLTDRGSWLAMRAQLRLRVLCQGDPSLGNHYTVIAVNPARHPHVNASGTRQLTTWLRSAEARALIADYRVDGEVVFHLPPAGPTRPGTP